MSESARSTVEVFREICKRILHSLLGESAYTAVLFYLRKNLGHDPFEVFWNDPKTFYQVLEKIFGAGAKLLIELLVSRINKELGLNMDPEYFLELMCSGDKRSVEKIQIFLTKIVESYTSKGGASNEEGSIKVPSRARDLDELIDRLLRR